MNAGAARIGMMKNDGLGGRQRHRRSCVNERRASPFHKMNIVHISSSNVLPPPPPTSRYTRAALSAFEAREMVSPINFARFAAYQDASLGRRRRYFG